MEYTKKHIAVIEGRLLRYDEVLASKEFVKLDPCGACKTAKYDCSNCLFGADWGVCGIEPTSCLNGPSTQGDCCLSKKAQAEQYNHLLRQLDKNGYQFKAVK